MQQYRIASSTFTGARLPQQVARPTISARKIKVLAAVKVGDKAPEFILKDQDGRDVKVSFGGFTKKPYVIFFYPKDNTPGCTIEAKTFAEKYGDLKKLGAEVIGISADPVDSKKAFCDSLNLPYKMLSDPSDKVRSLYGVPKDLLGLLPGRQTYVIGKDGVVKLVYNNQFGPEKHVSEAIKALSQ